MPLLAVLVAISISKAKAENHQSNKHDAKMCDTLVDKHGNPIPQAETCFTQMDGETNGIMGAAGLAILGGIASALGSSDTKPAVGQAAPVINVINGTDQNDEIFRSSGADSILADEGDDTIYSSPGSDTMTDGDDSLFDDNVNDITVGETMDDGGNTVITITDTVNGNSDMVTLDGVAFGRINTEFDIGQNLIFIDIDP